MMLNEGHFDAELDDAQFLKLMAKYHPEEAERLRRISAFLVNDVRAKRGVVQAAAANSDFGKEHKAQALFGALQDLAAAYEPEGVASGGGGHAEVDR